MADEILKLISWVGNKNIAEDIQEQDDGEGTLKLLATRVIEDFSRDEDSMQTIQQKVP